MRSPAMSTAARPCARTSAFPSFWGMWRWTARPLPGTAYCTLHYDDAPPVLFDGAQVRFEGRVYLPDGKSGEPHMDFALWMRQSGQSFGVAAYQGIAVLNAEADAPVRDAAYRVRQAFTRALERVMGEEARVAVALLLGEREGLSQQEREAFETLGVAHVMSVSGLHVGLLGGLAARFAALPARAPRAAAAGAGGVSAGILRAHGVFRRLGARGRDADAHAAGPADRRAGPTG